MLYIFVFVYTVLGAYLLQKLRLNTLHSNNLIFINTNKKSIVLHENIIFFLILAILVFTPLIAVHAFRYGFPSDYRGTYYGLFYQSQSEISRRMLRSDGIEVGYIFLNELVGKFTNNYVWALTCSSIVTFIILIIDIHRNVRVEAYALAVSMIFLSGFYFDSMQIVRQTLAASIWAFGIRYVYNRSFLKYLITIFVASLFHTSVWIMLPFYFLYRSNYKKVYVILTVFVTVLCSKFIYKFVEFIVNTVPKYSIYQGHLLDYSDNQYMYIYIFVLLLSISFCFSERRNKDGFWISIIVFGLCASLLSKNIPFISRVIYYALMANVFYIPDLILSIKDNKTKIMVLFAVVVNLMLIQILHVYIHNWYQAIPYVSIFSK